MMLFEELVEVVKEVLLNNSNSDDMLRAGDHFIYRGIEYVCLEIFGSEVYGHRAVFAVTTEIIKTMKFSEKYEDGCNNWRKSKVREWLNGEVKGAKASKARTSPSFPRAGPPSL